MATILAFPEEDSHPYQQDDMKLRDEDQRWLKGEIRNQIEAVLKPTLDEFRPRGWAKFIKVARDLAPLGVGATTIVALLALAAGAFYQVNSRISQEAKFEQHTDDRLDT